jgi:hypothetical protein
MAARHQSDLIFCRRVAGIAKGMVCATCDGRCPICDSFVHAKSVVRICDECNYGTSAGRCIVCGGPGVSEAYYCRECVALEKDRDGCPKIINIGAARLDAMYDKKAKASSAANAAASQ